MNKKQHVDATTLNQIIIRKLEGIANKIDITAQTPDDEKLGVHIRSTLKNQKKIAELLEEHDNASK